MIHGPGDGEQPHGQRQAEERAGRQDRQIGRAEAEAGADDACAGIDRFMHASKCGLHATHPYLDASKPKPKRRTTHDGDDELDDLLILSQVLALCHALEEDVADKGAEEEADDGEVEP